MTRLIAQTILSGQLSSIPVYQCSLDSLAQNLSGSATLGLSVSLTPTGDLSALALATTYQIYLCTIAGAHTTSQGGRGNALPPLFSGGAPTIAAFGMARIALHVYRGLNLHVHGVDLETVIPHPTKPLWSPADFVSRRIQPGVDVFPILQLCYPAEDQEQEIERLCLRAWITALCADDISSEFENVHKVDTRNLRDNELACLGDMVRTIEALENLKPLSSQGEFKELSEGADGVNLENARYKTRVRRSDTTRVILETKEGHRIVGQAVHAEGKHTRIAVTQGVYRGGIGRIRVEGKEELTCAERARDEFLLRLLQGAISLAGRPFVDLIWFPAQSQPRQTRPVHGVPTSNAFTSLNDSQKQVAAAMISTTESIVIAHGPPGTGKTTTIAAAVDYWSNSCPFYPSVWVVAQSNVGVKNIARSFVGKDFHDFKLIVSKEFHFEWHEHLYEELQEKLIRSDELAGANGGAVSAERVFLDCRVILCTLSMLSNRALDQCGVFRVNPVERLVVDEASQINITELMHLLHKFTALEKLCLFGDPKQLPPYGEESVSGLQCIFDLRHLKPRAYFLNTQYRMPEPLGQFISEHVYNNKLRSVHHISDQSCIAFVDAAKGVEQKRGTSWVNHEEVRLIVCLVQNYYRRKKFCVITPYDAQRSAIQKALEIANVPHDRVYNVDSFQGHEEEYVIVSAVRTERTGFLSVLRRNNVMLTRCKRGMVIVANRFFVEGDAQRTLLGQLASIWKRQSGNHSVWMDWRDITSSHSSLELPGFVTSKPVLATGSKQKASAPVQRRYVPGSVGPPAPPPPPKQITAPAPAQRVYARIDDDGFADAGSSSSVVGLVGAFGGMSLTRQPQATPSSGPSRRLREDAYPLPGEDLYEVEVKPPKVQGAWKKSSKKVKSPSYW